MKQKKDDVPKVNSTPGVGGGGDGVCAAVKGMVMSGLLMSHREKCHLCSVFKQLV